MNENEPYSAELAVAVEAVQAACRVTEQVRERLSGRDTVTKDDLSPVTVADYAVQAVMNMILGQYFPDDPITAEEDTDELGEDAAASLRARITEAVQQEMSDKLEKDVMEAIGRGSHPGGSEGRFWTLDPIDGTKGYLRGDQYAIALALIENGKPMLGVMGCPRLTLHLEGGDVGPGVVLSGTDGGPARLHMHSGELRNIHVSGREDPKDMVFCESVESGHSNHRQSDAITSRLGVQSKPARIDSQAKYAVVAAGTADVYLRLPTRADYREKIWDHAAGYRILLSAGGTVSDVDGKPLDFSRGRRLEDNRGVVAANAVFHERIVAAVKDVLRGD